MIAAPIFVSKKNGNSTGIFAEMEDRQGRNVFVSIEIEEMVQDGKSCMEVDEVTSVHGRQNTNAVLPVGRNNSIWVDKKKGLDWLSSVNPDDSQEIDSETLSDAAKIVETFGNPKLPESGILGDALFRGFYGGNRGYVGHSMSRRAAEAREEGRYPKTDFRKTCGLTRPSLELLVEAGYVGRDGEWRPRASTGSGRGISLSGWGFRYSTKYT